MAVIESGLWKYAEAIIKEFVMKVGILLNFM